jgi:PKD repeat protein
MVYDSLAKWNIGKYNPVARFSYSISNGNQVSFTSNSLFADSFTWDFGDGNISYSKSPINIFRYPGTYKIKLTAYHCGWKDSILQNVLITVVDTMPVQIILGNGIYPNPVSSQLNVTNKDALAKQYRITDSRGALVKTGILQSQYNKIDVSVLQAGTYYIECYAGNKLYWSKQFVKFSHQ